MANIDRSDLLRRWRTMSATDRFDNFYRAVNDVHQLRMRCLVLTRCVGRMYEARCEDDRFKLAVEARRALGTFVASFERDGVPMCPVNQERKREKTD